MSKRAFDRRVEALAALRAAGDSAGTRAQLRTALEDRNNYVVSRAASVAADLRCAELLPDLLTAYDRFFVDPAKSDPQCLAKNALVQALRDLGHHGAPAYVRGIAHVQLEPAFGGRADSAATLRGRCALALTDCLLDDMEILTYLADALADPDTLVRIDSAIAINQLGRMEGALLLRLKLLMGDREPDVLGQCFASFLSLAPPGSVDFVSRFLKVADVDLQLEAATALAQCRDPQAIGVLQKLWKEPLLSLEFRRVLLINLGASPLPEAAEFLMSVIARESSELASGAITALSTSRFRTDLQERIATAVRSTGNPDLGLVFEQRFSARSG